MQLLSNLEQLARSCLPKMLSIHLVHLEFILASLHVICCVYIGACCTFDCQIFLPLLGWRTYTVKVWKRVVQSLCTLLCRYWCAGVTDMKMRCVIYNVHLRILTNGLNGLCSCISATWYFCANIWSSTGISSSGQTNVDVQKQFTEHYWCGDRVTEDDERQSKTLYYSSYM